MRGEERQHTESSGGHGADPAPLDVGERDWRAAPCHAQRPGLAACVQRSGLLRVEIDGDLAQRVPRGQSNDEFDRLAESLNRMLERIEALMNGMRLVTDSLAHDLRSPLTRLKGRIELTLLGPEDPEAYRQTLEQALGEIDIIQSTFNDLLAIAEAESGASRTRLEPLELDGMVTDVAELYSPVLEDAGMELDTSELEPAVVLGHRQLLAQALANLLDNAVKYAGAGGRIELSLRTSAGRAELGVRDYGPGVPEEARERVLERFVRLDAARSRPGRCSLVGRLASRRRGRRTTVKKSARPRQRRGTS